MKILDLRHNSLERPYRSSESSSLTERTSPRIPRVGLLSALHFVTVSHLKWEKALTELPVINVDVDIAVDLEEVEITRTLVDGLYPSLASGRSGWDSNGKVATPPGGIVGSKRLSVHFFFPFFFQAINTDAVDAVEDERLMGGRTTRGSKDKTSKDGRLEDTRLEDGRRTSATPRIQVSRIINALSVSKRIIGGKGDASWSRRSRGQGPFCSETTFQHTLHRSEAWTVYKPTEQHETKPRSTSASRRSAAAGTGIAAGAGTGTDTRTCFSPGVCSSVIFIGR